MVYQFQDPGTFPALNCPLYLMALGPWLKLTGTTVLAVRSFNYTLLAIAAFLVWLASWKLNLVKSTRARLLLLALLHLGYGMSFAYRCSRPDILGLVGLLLMLFSFRLEHRSLRDLCLALSAALTVWIGLQVALFAWFACLIAWRTTRWTGLRELVVLSAGMAAGAAGLVVFLASKGVLSPFLALTTGILGKHYAHAHSLSVGAKILKVLTQILISNVDDFTTLALTLALVAVFLAARQRLSGTVRSLLVFALVLVFTIPALFNLVGHYAFYYSSARFVPASLACFAVGSELRCFARAKDAAEALPWCLRLLCVAALVGGAALGLPMRLAITAACAHAAPRAEVQRILRQHISPNDVVLSHYANFFVVKQTAKYVYDRYCSPALHYTIIPGRDLTPEQKQAVSVLVIRPNEKKLLTEYFGGEWTAVC